MPAFSPENLQVTSSLVTSSESTEVFPFSAPLVRKKENRRAGQNQALSRFVTRTNLDQMR